VLYDRVQASSREDVQTRYQNTSVAQRGARAPLAAPTAPTILLVEDEASIRRVLERLLRLDGYQVEGVTNGQEALAACERGRTRRFCVICGCRS
jgi:PleD family two-component response regulator